MAYPAIERHQRVISEPVYLTTGLEQNLALQDVAWRCDRQGAMVTV